MSLETSENVLFSQENVTMLLSLIAGGGILNNRRIDTSANKAESTAEWKKFENAFNVTYGTSRCTLQLLRNKWTDLKMKAMLYKYNAPLLRYNKTEKENETGVRNQKYFDLILNQVGLLLAKCEEEISDVLDNESPTQIKDNTSPNVPSRNTQNRSTYTPVFHLKSSFKTKLLKPNDGCIARNITFLKYHKIKRSYIECKIENIKLRNSKLKYEIIKLKNEVHDILIDESMQI